MNEEQVTSEVRTQAVLSAFQRAKLSSLPDQVKHDYDAQQLLYDQVSDYTADKVAEGEAKGRADATTDAVRGMKLQKFSNEDIARILKLTVHEVAAINIK